MDTKEIAGSLEWASENAPTYCEGVADLYSWSSNYNNFEPFVKFLDLIGYSEDEYGAPQLDWTDPTRSLGYVELAKLAEALTEYANRPHDVVEWVRQLLAIESEVGL